MCLLVLVAGLLAVPGAGASTIPVSSLQQLTAALGKAKGGDVISLANGVYGRLDVTKQNYGSPGITIRGGRGAVLNNIVFNASSNITVSGISLSPVGQQANIAIQVNSHNITIDNIEADGVNENLGARIRTNDSTSNVTIQDSDFTQCGRATPCNGIGGTNVVVQNNTYHDCADCDFIHIGGTNVQVIGNTLDNGYRQNCPNGCHIDLVQILSGEHILIAGNRFGYRENGAAQLFMSPANKGAKIDDVTVVNNLFWPGNGPHAMLSSIRVASHFNLPLPSNVRIVSNTIMTGATSSIGLDDDYAKVPLAQRPLVADNVILLQMPRQCPNGQWVDNLFTSGTTCGSGGNDVGSARLDGNYKPTSGSSLVINHANGTAPTRDANGCTRAGAPDRGAFEYDGKGCTGSPGVM